MEEREQGFLEKLAEDIRNQESALNQGQLKFPTWPALIALCAAIDEEIKRTREGRL